MVIYIFSFIWILLHFVYSGVAFIARVWVRLRRSCLELLHRNNSERKDLEFISRETIRLKKTPCHIIVILGNETISFKDLANLIIWCIAARIPFVSFYDHNGVLKKDESKLFKVLAEGKKGYLENIMWGKKSCTNGIVTKNGTKNGITTQKIHVNIYSHIDGKGSIADITSKLCQSVLAGELALSDVTEDLLNERLLAEMGVPDPELGICCGSSVSTFGLLPWQIRTTEFLQITTHHNLRVRDFVDLLHIYSRCEQRLGK